MTDYLAIARECGAGVYAVPECGPGIYDIGMTETQLSAFAERVRQDERERPIDLSDYINAAKINGSDAPHVVVEKLQAAIDAAMVQQVQERAE
jgi:hypothetical protein